MRHLSLLLCAGLITLGSFAACGSDDGSKKVKDGEAGAGGADAGGGGEPNSGGSSNPAAGEGGVPAAAGQGGANAGAPPVSMAGEGGASEGGTGGVPLGGAGGAGEGGGGGEPFDCPAEPGTFQYSCGELTGLGSPAFNLGTGAFVVNLANLEVPLASGSVSYFYSGADSQQCGATTVVQSIGSDVTAQVPLQFPPSFVRIVDFDFVDVCGSHHVYEPIGVICNELTGSAGSGSISLNCAQSPGPGCPAQCE